jgi:hypothetical protein
MDVPQYRQRGRTRRVVFRTTSDREQTGQTIGDEQSCHSNRHLPLDHPQSAISLEVAGKEFGRRGLWFSGKSKGSRFSSCDINCCYIDAATWVLLSLSTNAVGTAGAWWVPLIFSSTSCEWLVSFFPDFPANHTVDAGLYLMHLLVVGRPKQHEG